MVYFSGIFFNYLFANYWDLTTVFVCCTHRLVGAFLCYCPETCFIVEDETQIYGYVLVASDAKTFYQRIESDWIPSMMDKYRLPDNAVAPLSHCEVVVWVVTVVFASHDKSYTTFSRRPVLRIDYLAYRLKSVPQISSLQLRNFLLFLCTS